MDVDERYCAARSMRLGGMVEEARAELEQISGEEMDPPLACRFWSLLGTVRRECGDVLGALEAFEQAREYLPLSGEFRPLMAGVVPFEESIALWQQGGREDAIAHLRLAQDAFEASGDRQHTAWAVLWRSWLLAEVGETDGADLALDDAKRFIHDREDWLRHALTAAYVALSRHQAGRALELVAGLQRRAGDEIPLDVRALSTAIHAEALAGMGGGRAALIMAATAEEQAAKCSDWRVRHVVQQIVERIQSARV